MNFESAKKFLKVIGTITIIGAIISIIFGVFFAFLGGVGITMPDFKLDKETAQGVVTLLGGGIGIIIAGIYSLIEGFVSVSAAKTGKHTMAALVFAVLALIGACFRAYDMFVESGFNVSNVIGVAAALIINILVVVAASAVRKHAKEA